jgi:hypothetical protein
MTTTALPFGLTGVTYSPNLSEQLLPYLPRSMITSFGAARRFAPAGACMPTAQAAPAARIVCGAGCGAERAGSAPACLLMGRGTCAAEDMVAARTGMWRKARQRALHHHFLAGKREEQYKPATGSHAKRLWQPCQPEPSWPPVDYLQSLLPLACGTG